MFYSQQLRQRKDSKDKDSRWKDQGVFSTLARGPLQQHVDEQTCTTNFTKKLLSTYDDIPLHGNIMVIEQASVLLLNLVYFFSCFICYM